MRATHLCVCALGLLAASQPVVKSGTQLVRVTILARDHNGKPVRGLKASDFTLSEDGKPQEIAFFDAESATRPTTSAPDPTAAHAAPDGGVRFSNLVASDRIRNVTVILLDRLNTAWADQAHARDAIRKFLSQVRADDRVALYALDGTALHVLHDFTSDTAALLRALNGAARMTSTNTDAQTQTSAVPDPGATGGGGAQTYASPFDDTESYLQFVGQAAYTTITALQTIGQHLAGVPGRKSVVWISSAFPSAALLVHAVDRTSELQRATRSLNTAGISVYPIDARGLIGAFSDPGTATRPPTFTTLNVVHTNTEILHSIADDTGGRVFMNTNDIAGAIRSAIDDADAYYVLGYYPPAGAADGRYRKIDVKAASGVDLRYRHGYFATQADLSGGDRKTSLERALRDVIDATGIPVTVSTSSTGTSGQAELAIAADGRALTLTSGPNGWTGGVDVTIAQITRDGSLHVDMDTTINLKLSDAQHEQVLASGLTLTRHITVAPEAGRIAVVLRDTASGTLGSVFLPADKLRNAR